MSHTALARKYRPKRFAEVATQDHVSETLRRAVVGGRVGHAYLFSGPRGIGKTTLARVLAMALNCPDGRKDGEPCGECESCRRIWSGQTGLDVVEIDAASNRGVDDARDLRERAMYSPSGDGRFKVYILDEAHMLTREAWNALLKVLEEPPPRVIFIFATTEPQKIQQSASPILSRCQRFDFRRIGVGDIVKRLQEVLSGEGTEAPEEALRTIARRADGGMRDALSLLDQVLALTGGDVSQDAVRRVLGLVEEERYVELLGILAERRHGDVFSFVEALLDEGYDMVEFHRGLVDVFRLLLRYRLGQGEGGKGFREDLRESFRDQAEAFSPGDLVRMLAQATELEATGSLRRSGHPRLLMEMLLLRLSYLDRTVQLESLLKSLGPEDPSGEGPSPGINDGGKGAPTMPKGDRGASLPARERSKPARGASQPAQEAPQPAQEAPQPAQEAPQATGGASQEAGDGEASGGASPEGRDDPLSLPEAWNRALLTPNCLPKGVLPFLRAARVEFSADGQIEISVLPGPGLERLQDRIVLRNLREVVGRFSGSVPKVTVKAEGPAQGSVDRITEESVRDGKLRELVDKEPALEEAVKELDLEFLD